jgi:kinesin family protein 5
MCSYNEKETLSTLQFGQRAKCIKNTVTANIERSAKELERLLEIAEIKVKEYENVIKKLTAGEKITFPLLTMQSQIQEEAPILKEEVMTDIKQVDEQSPDQSPPAKPVPKPKKKICYTIGTQTDPLRELEPKAKNPKKKSKHEEVDMMEGMNSEEELAYLLKMEEEALKKLEEEENRLKEQKEKEKAARDRANLIIPELDADYEDSPQPKPGVVKHFISKHGSNKDIEVPADDSEENNNKIIGAEAENTKGPTEAAYIAQTLQLIDKNLELKKTREEKEMIEDEVRHKKEEIEDLKERLSESQEIQRTFQLACRSFVEKIKRGTERALEESQNKTNLTLKLARDLDEVKLKLLFIANDSDLKHLLGKGLAETQNYESVAELSKPY